MARIRHTLAAFGALVAAACSSSPGTQPPAGTPTPDATTPSATASATASLSPSVSPTPQPSPTRSRRPRRSPTPLPPSPTTTSSTPAPPNTPTSAATVVVGRPLRHRRRLLAPGVGRGDAPLHPDHERLAGLPEPTRRELGRLWLGAARMEHASVPAFAEIALLLAAVGAPLDLVAAASRAALQEVEHTRLSYALGNAYAGTSHAPGALPRLLGRQVGSRLRGRGGALRKLAVEALRDGCLLEGYAGALAAAGAASATDPAAREALDRIATDEASHAELSWRLLGWCLDTGGRRIRRAVARSLERLPRAAAPPTAETGLAAHGWPPPDQAAKLFDGVRAGTVARARDLLALSAH